MVHLIRHFGDVDDQAGNCGMCDVCDSQACSVQQSRTATREESDLLRHIVTVIAQRPGVAVGALFRDHVANTGVERDVFEQLIAGLSRSGILEVREDVFEKDGKKISFQRLNVKANGATPIDLSRVKIPMAFEGPAGSGKTRRRKPKARKPAQPREPAQARRVVGAKRKRVVEAVNSLNRRPTEFSVADEVTGGSLADALRRWRLLEARKGNVPAFRIMTDRTLQAVASARPANADALLAVPGVGPALTKKYGTRILHVVQSAKLQFASP